MKTTAAVVAVLVVIGIIWAASSNGGTSDKSLTGSQTGAQANLPEGTVISNPSELASKGGQYKCTFSMTDSNADASGTIFIDGNKFRGDFKSTVKTVNQTVNTYTISDGSYSYTWTGNTNTGFKVPVVNKGTGGTAMSGNMDFTAFGANTSWKCVSAKLDAATFALPTTINFIQSPAR